MTAIAWAIMFIGLLFYGAIWDDKLKVDKIVGGLTLFCLIMLTLSTLRDWAK